MSSTHKVARKVNENVPVRRSKADAIEQPTYRGQYEQMLDIVAVQDKRLLNQENKIQFLRSLQTTGQETFGFENLARRQLEPSMYEIFSYGYEAPIKNDYTKNKAELSNKIRKMKRAFISESHDNYRKPKAIDEEAQVDQMDSTANQLLLFNYFDHDEIELFKKKLFQKATLAEREIRNQTMYKEFFGSADALRLKLREIETWSAAGQKAPICQKRSVLNPNLTQKQGTLWIFGERPELFNKPVWQKLGVDQGGRSGPLVHPAKLQWEFIEAKLREMGFTPQTVAAAAAAYAEERAEEAARQNVMQQSSLATGNFAELPDDEAFNFDDKELSKEEKRSIREKMKKLKNEGRLLADSAMTTYFGKPAFHSYGNGNTRPASGGLLYGQYLKTHNVNPHSGSNKPINTQVYGRALINPKNAIRGATKSQMVRVPHPPRQPLLKRPLTGKQLDELKTRGPIMPEGLTSSQQRVLIQKPEIKPDLQMVHKMRLDKHQKSNAAVRKQSPRAHSVRYQHVNDYQSNANSSKMVRVVEQQSEATSTHQQDLSEHAEFIAVAPLADNESNMGSQRQQLQLNASMPYCPRHQENNLVSPGKPDQTHMMVQAPATEMIHMLNPKNYRYLPAEYTQQIRGAGKKTAESDSFAGVFAHQ